MSRLLQFVIPKFLDFSDYKKTRSRIRNLEYQVTELQYRLRHYADIDNYYAEILSILRPTLYKSSTEATKVTRIGSNGDGGYLILTESASNSMWITFGLGTNTDFEKELVNNGCTVNAFDHTLDIPPSIRNQHFKWHKHGLSSVSSSTMITLQDLEREHVMQGRDWHLKFDIEGNEWNILEDIPKMKNPPRSIACELHNLRWTVNSDDNLTRLHRLRSLTESYEVLHINGNNYSANLIGTKSSLHDVMEVLLVKSVKSHLNNEYSPFRFENQKNDIAGNQTETELLP